MKKLLRLILLFIAVLTAGCGYRVGSIMHPQIKSIAIAPVSNETMLYNVSAQMRGILSEVFQTDGSLKLKSEGRADCILYAKITKAEFSQITWENNTARNSDDFLPDQWRVKITAEIAVMIPGRAEPLIRPTDVSGSTTFVTGADMESSRRYAVRQACFAAAKKAVVLVTESW